MSKRPPKFRKISEHILLVKRTQAPGTYALAKHYLKRLEEHFGEMPVSKITEFHWGSYVSACKKRQPTRKLHDDKKFMSQVMLTAYRQGFLPRPVRLRVPCPRSDAGREITPQELTRLFSLANPELRFQMEVALKSGLRRSELLRLKWDRFQWEERAIRLRPEDTKTRKGRIIPLPLELFRQFRARYAMRKGPCVFSSRFDPSRPLLDNKTAWQNLKRRAQVKTRWHDFRHTCATRLLRKGISITVAALYLGMSERILRDIYAHLNLDDLRKAADAMSEIRQRRGRLP